MAHADVGDGANSSEESQPRSASSTLLTCIDFEAKSLLEQHARFAQMLKTVPERDVEKVDTAARNSFEDYVQQTWARTQFRCLQLSMRYETVGPQRKWNGSCHVLSQSLRP